MTFLRNPNIPDAEVELAAVSGIYPEFVSGLHNFGIDTIIIRSKNGLEPSICAHADMLCHPLGGRDVIIASGENYLRTILSQHGFFVYESKISIKSPYPRDCLLNAARIGNKIIANVSSLDPLIWEYCEKNNIEVIAVQQGYAKCSILIVNENAIITADRSIEQAAKRAGIDVLLIRPGYVELKGYPYGFLGGTCGLISKNQIVFTGNILTHPDAGPILYFLKQYGIDARCLANGFLKDIGGIVPLKMRECLRDR